jgi:hypothetical protein
MAIDYIINHSCIPKQTLGTGGILDRLKGQERARTIIKLFRQNGDERPPSEMGFEFTRRGPDGEEENRVIVVQELLDAAEELRPLEQHCVGCPANRTDMPFGCMGFINYPITEAAENWLLDRLPVPDEPLVWLLLKQVMQEFKYDGSTVNEWRVNGDMFFETPNVNGRRLGELSVDSNQVFEMLFGRREYIMPRQAALLLLFFRAVERDLEADQIKQLDPAPVNLESVYPFVLKEDEKDDNTTSELKAFFRAMYLAWKLDVNLLLDV